MRRKLPHLLAVVVLAATLATATAAPASARTVPLLTYHEAATAIGSKLLRHFEFGAMRGSLLTDCRRIARNRVWCRISFQDLAGTYWCGVGRVRERRTSTRVHKSVRQCTRRERRQAIREGTTL